MAASHPIGSNVSWGHLDKVGIDDGNGVKRILPMTLERNAVAKVGHETVYPYLIVGEVEKSLRHRLLSQQKEQQTKGEPYGKCVKS